MANTIKTIKVKCYSDVREEFTGSGAINPGHLLYLTSGGLVAVHNVAGGNALPMFAIENELYGKGVDTAYTSGDRIQVWIPGRGDMVNAVLAAGQNVGIGDFIESAGDGTLQKYVADVDSSADITTIYPLQIVGQAVEALDLSGSGAVATRIVIRIV